MSSQIPEFDCVGSCAKHSVYIQDVPEGMDQLEQGPSRAHFLAFCSENGGPMVLNSIAYLGAPSAKRIRQNHRTSKMNP